MPIAELKWKLAELLRLALHYRKMTGDRSFIDTALRQARQLYEAEFKPRRNLGQMDKDWVESFRKSLERLEKE